MDRIKQYVEEYPDIIKFTGFIHNTELYKYYALSNVSVIPSTYEDPAPLVPIEGMANGIPLIVSNTGGAWEYVSDECALQVIKENNLVDQIADSIVNLMNNADKQQMMRISAKNRAKLFTSDQFYADFIEMLNGLDKRL